jgi:hypothetical protein
MIDVSNDPRIDPRIKTVLGALGTPGGGGDAESREQLLAEANTDEAIAQRAMITTLLAAADNEEIAPSKGLNVTEHSVVYAPDGNTINACHRPDGQPSLPPCYIHGGGMQTLSRYDGNYRVKPHHRRARGRRRDGRLSQRSRPRRSRGRCSPPDSTTASPVCAGSSTTP